MKTALFATNCDECDMLIGYMTSHPRGCLICPACHDRHEAEEYPQNEVPGENSDNLRPRP